MYLDDNQCIPNSNNINYRKGCNSYYLVSDHLYYYKNTKCEDKDMTGYFGNVNGNNGNGYIKCTSNGFIITCNKLDLQQ